MRHRIHHIYRTFVAKARTIVRHIRHAHRLEHEIATYAIEDARVSPQRCQRTEPYAADARQQARELREARAIVQHIRHAHRLEHEIVAYTIENVKAPPQRCQHSEPRVADARQQAQELRDPARLRHGSAEHARVCWCVQHHEALLYPPVL